MYGNQAEAAAAAVWVGSVVPIVESTDFDSPENHSSVMAVV